MFGLGTTELVLILVIVVIVFGVGKLPDIGSGLGKAIKNFKKTTNDTALDITGEEDKPKLKATGNESGTKA